MNEGKKIDKKYILSPKAINHGDPKTGTVTKHVHLTPVVGNRISCDFYQRFVTHRAQYSLSHGVLIDGKPSAQSMGVGFDNAVATAAQYAQVHGVCWGYWNHDHLELFPAYEDALSGFVALLDERDSQPMVGIRFWQIDTDRPMWVQLYELDGMTEYRKPKDAQHLIQYKAKQAYYNKGYKDAAGYVITETGVYSALPVVPLFANKQHRSTLTTAIKCKIDAYDVITSDFADNLEKTNEIYWVLNNFGGSTSEIVNMMETINELKVVANISDGTGSSSAEPKSFEVPYAARSQAVALLTETLHDDAMVVNLKEITGGSLTNVAIEVAFTRMDLGADELEWEVFIFVQQLLALAGIQTENITFKRSRLFNTAETIQEIYTMRNDISQRKALALNPLITNDEIEQIMQESAQEAAARREMEAVAAAVNDTMAEEDSFGQ